MKPPPVSRKPVVTGNPEDTKKVKKAIRLAQNNTFRERLFKGLRCSHTHARAQFIGFSYHVFLLDEYLLCSFAVMCRIWMLYMQKSNELSHDNPLWT